MTGKHDRPRANWVAIEREYGAGQVSLRAFGPKQRRLRRAFDGQKCHPDRSSYVLCSVLASCQSAGSHGSTSSGTSRMAGIAFGWTGLTTGLAL